MEVYYDSQSVSSNSVKLLYRSFLTSDRFHYVPTKAEIRISQFPASVFQKKRQEAVDMMGENTAVRERTEDL